MSEGVAVRDVLVLGLAAVRLFALLATAPIFGQSVLSVRVRAALALVVAFAVMPRLALPPEALAGGLQRVAFAALGEALLGIALGFTTRLIFAAFTLFGEIVSMQGGIGAITTIDPQSGAASGALPLLFDLVAGATFLALDGHHAVLRAASFSFGAVPIGTGGASAAVLGAIGPLLAGVFDLALRLAAPVTVAMLAGNVSLGILARVVPQMNLLVVQLPAQIALALFLLGVAGQAIVRVSGNAMGQWSERVSVLLLGGVGGG